MVGALVTAHPSPATLTPSEAAPSRLPEVLLGTLANQRSDGRWLFGVGATVASTALFVSLGFGARRLAGLFASPRTWRLLDGLIAAIMVALGISLALTPF